MWPQKKNAKNTWSILLCTCLIATIIFVILYAPFLFGGKMYAYHDVGGDTIHQYLPVMQFELERLEQGLGDGYALNYGLGRYQSGLWEKYLNPVNLPLLLFGSENLHAGILAATWMRYMIICGVGAAFFLRVTKNGKAAMICALLWTFCSYNVSWGQHYHFLSAMAGVTVCLYGFQLFLDQDKKQWLVVLTTAYLLSISYYFMYMTCFFMLIYGVLYLRAKKTPYAQIGKRIGWFALAMIPAVCIAAPILTGDALNFLSSARTGAMTSGFDWKMLIPYPLSTLMGYCARWLSNDLIGVGNLFRGSTNYYECAAFSVSILFFFAAAYLMMSRYRYRTLGCILLGMLALGLPIVSKILVFYTNTQRWSYVLCIAQVLAIGFAAADFAKCEDRAAAKKRAVKTLLLGDGILAVLAAILLLYHRAHPGWLDKRSCLIMVGVCAMYHLVIWLAAVRVRMRSLLLAAIAAELVITNYAGIHARYIITLDQWQNAMYNDGSAEVVDWIHQKDDSLYRINKTFGSVNPIANSDPLMQGFAGLSVYSSVNSAQLMNLYDSYGYDAGSWMWFPATDNRASNMLGCKYLISRENENPDPGQYELIYDENGFQVYENRHWLGFGYLYDEEITASEVMGRSRDVQEQILAGAYYRTDMTAQPEDSPAEGIQYLELAPMLADYDDCVPEIRDTSLMVAAGKECRLIFDIPELERGWEIVGLEIVLDAQEPSSVQIYAGSEEEASAASASYDAGKSVLAFDWSYGAPKQLRLDPAQNEQEIAIERCRLVLRDGQLLETRLQKLRESAIMDMRQDGNSFSGMVVNPDDREKMLCVPLLYSDFWQVELNGIPVDIENINGGLLGIVVPEGTWNIRIVYRDTLYRAGKILGAVSLFGYLAAVCAVKRKQSTKEGKRLS